jgi:hypothetical protein
MDGFSSLEGAGDVAVAAPARRIGKRQTHGRVEPRSPASEHGPGREGAGDEARWDP